MTILEILIFQDLDLANRTMFGLLGQTCKCGCAHQGGCLSCGCTCPPKDPRQCPCCGKRDK